MVRILACSACLALSACGTIAYNSDTPSGISLGGREIVPDDATVAIVPSGPDLNRGGVKVIGNSCKNKIWDPAPSRENAVALLKRDAAAKGMNAVHALVVTDQPAAILANCWAMISAEGIAFKQ